MLAQSFKSVHMRMMGVTLARHLLRWLLGAAIAIGLLTLAAKVLSVALPPAALLGVMGLFVAVGLAVAIEKIPNVGQCALQVDRSLGCQERISTAMELIRTHRESDLARAQIADAERWFGAAPLGRVFTPYRQALMKQVGVTAVAFLLAGLLWIAPGLNEWRPGSGRDGAAAVQQEGEKLQAVVAVMDADPSALSPEQKALVKEARESVRKLMSERPDVREAMRELARLKAKVHQALSKTALHSPAEEAFSELNARLGEALSALGSQLRKSGSPAETPVILPESAVTPLADISREEGTASGASPHAARENVSRIFQPGSGSEPAVPFDVSSSTVQKMLERQEWPRQYDALVRKYFTD